MNVIAVAPIWLIAILIFALRIVDVSLGTLRTVSIVRGYIIFAAILGFFEVGIWITVVAQLITRMGESWLLIIAYAGGFSAGNVVGILIERRIALGIAVVRLISSNHGAEIAAKLREIGYTVTTIQGEGIKGPVTLVYVAGPRRKVRAIVATAKAIDDRLFFVVEPAQESSGQAPVRLRPISLATGWRAITKKK